MKSKTFWAIFRFQGAASARFLFIPAAFSFQMSIISNGSSVDLGIFGGLIATFAALAIFMSYGFLFQEGTFGFRRAESAVSGLTLEFPFSRALDRGTLYRARLLWFFLAGSFPLLVLLGSSFWNPDRTVPYYPNAHATSTVFQDFYLTHFKNASLETSYAFPPQPGMVLARIPKRHAILLPYGRIELAAVVLWFGLVAAAAYQALMLGTLRSRWCQRLLPIASCLVLPTGFLLLGTLDLTHRTAAILARAATPGAGPVEENAPPVFDQLLAWTLQHPLLPIVAGALVIFFALGFGRRRFVQQEVGGA